MILQQPLGITKRVDQYDLMVSVAGGGLSGQAGAVRHGLSKHFLLTSRICDPSSRKRAS